MKSRSINPTIRSEEDILTFGKYQGKSVRWILDNNPGYIVWLVEMEVCEVEQEIYNKAEIYDREDSDYYYSGIDIYDWMDEPF